MKKETEIISSLLFDYCLLNRTVYQLLENHNFDYENLNRHLKEMFHISDGIHRITKYESLSNDEKLLELTLFNQSLKCIKTEDSYSLIEIDNFVLSSTVKISKLLKLLDKYYFSRVSREGIA